MASPRNPVGQRQFLTGLLAAFKITGASVTTSSGVNTGLDIGQHLATIKKGSGADSNLVTVTFRNPLGMTPIVLFQPITLDCAARIESGYPTKSIIQFRTFLHSNLATKLDDANLIAYVYGTEEIREGNY